MKLELLKKYVDDGYLFCRTNSTKTLVIYNYTPATAYERNWNEITKVCRV